MKTRSKCSVEGSSGNAGKALGEANCNPRSDACADDRVITNSNPQNLIKRKRSRNERDDDAQPVIKKGRNKFNVDGQTQCEVCGCKSTPLWRMVGDKMTCNACGLQYKRNGHFGRKKDVKKPKKKPQKIVKGRVTQARKTKGKRRTQPKEKNTPPADIRVPPVEEDEVEESALTLKNLYDLSREDGDMIPHSTFLSLLEAPSEPEDSPSNFQLKPKSTGNEIIHSPAMKELIPDCMSDSGSCDTTSPPILDKLGIRDPCPTTAWLAMFGGSPFQQFQ